MKNPKKISLKVKTKVSRTTKSHNINNTTLHLRSKRKSIHMQLTIIFVLFRLWFIWVDYTFVATQFVIAWVPIFLLFFPRCLFARSKLSLFYLSTVRYFRVAYFSVLSTKTKKNYPYILYTTNIFISLVRVVLFIWFVSFTLFLLARLYSFLCHFFLCPVRHSAFVKKSVYFVYWVDVFCNIYGITHMPGSIQSELPSEPNRRNWNPNGWKIQQNQQNQQRNSVFFRFLFTKTNAHSILFVFSWKSVARARRSCKPQETIQNEFFEYSRNDETLPALNALFFYLLQLRICHGIFPLKNQPKQQIYIRK